MKPAPGNSRLIPDLKASTSSAITAKPGTRDPRLLNRINTSHNGANPDILSASTTESPSMVGSAIDGRKDRGSHLAASSIAQTIGQIQPLHPQNRSSSAMGTADEQHADSATRLVTLLGSLVENTSSSAALKYEHSKIKARATHQENLDKKGGNLSKAFPAFAETSAKAKKDTEKDLAVVNQKLAEHEKAQADLLSVMPELFYASRTSVTTEKEREKTDMIKRCISVYEDLKSSVDDLKPRFEQYKLMASKQEEAYQSMENRIDFSAGQVKGLSSQMESMRVRCSKLDEKHDELRDSIQSTSGETRSSLAAVKNSLKQCFEQKYPLKAAARTATDAVDNLAQRFGGLTSQYQIFLDSDAVHARKTEELEKLAENHSREVEEIKVTASQNSNNLSDAVKSMNQQIQNLRQELSDVEIQRPSPPEHQELSALRTDFATLKADLLKLKNDKTDPQNPGQSGQRLSPISAEGISPLANDDLSRKNQSRLMDLETQLNNSQAVILNIQQRLLEKQMEEEERDELVAAQVDDIRASTAKGQGEVEHRIGDLERDIQKRRAEDLDRIQKLHDSFSQLSKTGNQISNPRISPPSAPPTPQLHRILQPQAKGSSPQPLIPAFPAEMNRRLDSLESLLSATGQQLQIVSMAYRQLETRYTNLSTEPIVRAILDRMPLMYPFASGAQQEIINLKHMTEPLRNVPLQLEALNRIADNHNARLTSIETRIDVLEKDKTKNDFKHDKLVEHVKEERRKLIEEVNNQKETVNGLGERLDRLEQCRNADPDEVNNQKETVNDLGERLDRLEQYRQAEPDKLKYLTETLAKKWEAETTKAVEGIVKRLDVLETGSSRQDLLEKFTARIPETVDQARELHDDDTDDSSMPLGLRKNSVKPKPPPPSTASVLGKTFPKTKTASNTRKRKRYGGTENNDRSDDDTYTPAAPSSPTRRKTRG